MLDGRALEKLATFPRLHPVLRYAIPAFAFAVLVGAPLVAPERLDPRFYSLGILPVLAVALLLGLRGGLLAATAQILLNICYLPRFVPIAFEPVDEIPTTVLGGLLLFALGGLVGALHEIARHFALVSRELQATLDKVKTLTGLLPICANCKRVRDDGGYWHQVETYVAAHADVRFTHGLCPECLKALYPEFAPADERPDTT